MTCTFNVKRFEVLQSLHAYELAGISVLVLVRGC